MNDTPSNESTFVDLIVSSCNIVREQTELAVVPFVITTTVVPKIDELLSMGYNPVQEFNKLYQMILNDNRCGTLGAAFLTFYCGTLDDPSPTRLQVRAQRIYQSAHQFRDLKLWPLSVWASELAEASYNQIGYKPQARQAQKLKLEATYQALQWWPKAGNNRLFSKRKIIRWKMSSILKKLKFTAWKYCTNYWYAPARTFMFGSIPTIFMFAGVYSEVGFNYQGHVEHNFWSALYLSGVTITTLGYGDASPLGVARVLAIGESLYGILLFSFVMVLFTRKYID